MLNCICSTSVELLLDGHMIALQHGVPACPVADSAEMSEQSRLGIGARPDRGHLMTCRLGWPDLLDHPFVRETQTERLKREKALADAMELADSSRAWKVGRW